MPRIFYGYIPLEPSTSKGRIIDVSHRSTLKIIKASDSTIRIPAPRTSYQGKFRKKSVSKHSFPVNSTSK